MIETDGNVTIRAPRFISNKHVDDFLKKKKDWIERKVKEAKVKHLKAQEIAATLTPQAVNKYKKKAREYLQERLDYYSTEFNLPYKVLRLSSAKTRWGSCSHQDNINLNWRLILAPKEIIDYLVVHELSHTKHRHHQKSFWNKVEEIYPNYKEAKKWLKQNSHLLSVSV